MFDAVKKGFRSALHSFEGRQEITEENIDEALKAIRMALFEADVNYRVVRTFLQRVKDKALGEVVQVRARHQGQTLRVSPGEVFIKICHDELEALMGPVDTSLSFVQERLGPTVIMMVGLQGAGKTTTTGKLARWLIHHHQKKPLLVAADVYRPAAIEQLKVLGERLEVPVFADPEGEPPDIVARAWDEAKATGRDVMLIDTAGRLAVDDLLMSELEEITRRVTPHNILLVVDAMIGQDAVNTAREFNERLELDGFIMTKLDGDARGGAALSIKEITGKPIKFVGMGEGLDSLQEFQPAGFADRVLGMGDIRSLVGRLENVITEREAREREQDAERMLRGEFDLSDFLNQIRTIKKLGSLTDILEMMPFGNALPEGFQVDDNELVRIEALIQSMTPQERRQPLLIRQQVTRQRRIARGSGRDVSEVTDLIDRFDMMKMLLGQMGGAQGGLLSKIPGFKQLSALRNLKNTDTGGLLQALGAGGNPFGGGAFGGMGNLFGAGGNPFAQGGAMPPGGMPPGGFPGLPPGYTPPGMRPPAGGAPRPQDRQAARKKARLAKAARKKNR
jgi:signal recognition particle subunit SRP54